LEAHHIIPLRDLGTIGFPVVTSSFRGELYPNETRQRRLPAGTQLGV
jgi:hypothetical protein